jgi:hypothetical protein
MSKEDLRKFSNNVRTSNVQFIIGKLKKEKSSKLSKQNTFRGSKKSLQLTSESKKREDSNPPPLATQSNEGESSIERKNGSNQYQLSSKKNSTGKEQSPHQNYAGRSFIVYANSGRSKENGLGFSNNKVFNINNWRKNIKKISPKIKSQ